MAGTLGDFVLIVGAHDPAVAARLGSPDGWPALPLADPAVHRASPAPGVSLWWRGAVDVQLAPRGALGLALEPCRGAPRAAASAPLARAAADWMSRRPVDPARLCGRFAFVGWDARDAALLAVADAFRTCPLAWLSGRGAVAVASDLRLLAATGLAPVEPSRAALYQYLNFSYVPAPLTAFEAMHKLPGGCRLEWRAGGQPRVDVWWDAHYPADLGGSDDERAAKLRETIVATVEDYRCADADGWGAFLSGGTDSSSICGILAHAHEHPLKSFSIGFAEPGYDELEYARIAARAFGLHGHEARVDEDAAVDAIGEVARAFDEPFGNASAIPTLHCARLASSAGVSCLVAGDGGDEIFGGNERYRKDALLERFHRAPAALRALGRGAAAVLGGVDARWANRVKNFVRRGGLPNPDRFYSDDAFASVHFDELLGGSFRRDIGVDDALDVQRGHHARADAADALHRLMYLDLKMTIADNDVVKVVRASRAAGVEVAFPFLDRRLVDFTGRLPVRDKLRGRQKRWLFKRAMADTLPQAIREKRKQGFGLPISVWLRRGGRYAQLVHDIVLSRRAVERGLFDPGFVRRLIERHENDAWDHAAEIHQLLMLELWLCNTVDAHAR